jgi:hypothetical protein
MHYMLLIYEDESVYGDKSNTPEMRSITERHMALVGELGATRISAAGLQRTASATTVRTEGGKQVVHDGPFAETKEQLGGYYLIEAPDLDAAIAIAKRVPLRFDGSIEVRPLIVH